MTLYIPQPNGIKSEGSVSPDYQTPSNSQQSTQSKRIGNDIALHRTLKANGKTYQESPREREPIRKSRWTQLEEIAEHSLKTLNSNKPNDTEEKKYKRIYNLFRFYGRARLGLSEDELRAEVRNVLSQSRYSQVYDAYSRVDPEIELPDADVDADAGPNIDITKPKTLQEKLAERASS